MPEEIRRIEFLTDEEKRRLFGWGKDIFGVEGFKLRWRPKDLHFVLYLDGKSMSHVGVLKQVVTVNGEPAIIGGVGGVVTLPEAQRRGFAGQLMWHVAKFFEHEWKVDAGLLFCLSQLAPYYEALGWRSLEKPVLIEQPSGKIPAPLHAMVLPFTETVWSNVSLDLGSLPW